MKKIASLLIGAFILTSCGSAFTLKSSNILNNADFTKYKTFAVLGPEDGGGQLPAGVALSDFNNMRTAIANEMIKRGFTQTKVNPDLVIGLAISAQQTVETKDALPPGAYAYNFIGPRAEYVRSYYEDAQIISDVYEEGLMAVDILDAKTNTHLFNSITSTIIDGSGKKVKDLSQLQAAAATAFKKFPIPAKK